MNTSEAMTSAGGPPAVHAAPHLAQRAGDVALASDLSAKPAALCAIDRLLATELPPVPLCFDGPKQWAGYLRALHTSGAPVLRRSDTGKWRGERKTRSVFRPIGDLPCADCSIGYARHMAAEGRCQLAQRLSAPAETTLDN